MNIRSFASLARSLIQKNQAASRRSRAKPQDPGLGTVMTVPSWRRFVERIQFAMVGRKDSASDRAIPVERRTGHRLQHRQPTAPAAFPANVVRTSPLLRIRRSWWRSPEKSATAEFAVGRELQPAPAGRSNACRGPICRSPLRPCDAGHRGDLPCRRHPPEYGGFPVAHPHCAIPDPGSFRPVDPKRASDPNPSASSAAAGECQRGRDPGPPRCSCWRGTYAPLSVTCTTWSG